MRRRLCLIAAPLVVAIALGTTIVLVATRAARSGKKAAKEDPMRFPAKCLTNVSDYTFMWWAYGWRGRSPEGHRVFCVQTSRYGLAFDVDEATITNLGAIDSPAPEAKALVQSNDVIFDLPASGLSYLLQVGDHTYRSVLFRLPTHNARIIESGKFMQRMELVQLLFEDEGGAPLQDIEARLELVSWPDRVALILHLRPKADLDLCQVQMRLAVAPEWSEVTAIGASEVEGDASRFASPEALCLAETGGNRGGIALLNPDPEETEGSVRQAKGRNEIWVQRSLRQWRAGEERSFAIAVMPVARNALSACQTAAAQESEPLTEDNLAVKGLSPYTGTLPVQFDRQRGWYKVALSRHDEGWDIGDDLDRIERVRVVLHNPDLFPRTIRLNFAKDYQFAGIVGMSPMIRDGIGYPTGLPVQISKNWHNPHWFHGLTMLTLPPKTTVPFEFTIAYAHWGGVPAASHAQLSLVGWGTHQLWDEAAIGSFGESICYDPDVNLMRSMIDDVRPLMVWSMTPDPDAQVKWGWTNNVGGGDFLVYYDADGHRQWLSRMRTSYRRYAPNLTQATYAGITPDGRIAAQITVSTARTDDVVRGLYHLRYDVLETTPFRRLAFFQLGADDYNDHDFDWIARGDATGLQEEWQPGRGGFTYHRTGIPCEGEQPWFSLHGASAERARGGAWANRGLIVRSWRARLGGKDRPIPYAASFGTLNNMVPSANIELSPPPDVDILHAGDFVEAEIEMVVLPMVAEDYYGPNRELYNALEAHPDSWELVWREARGNALEVVVQHGRIERVYPLQVKVNARDRAEFTVKGGIGYVPMTFTGLSDYRDVILMRRGVSGWQPVDQAVHGNDFWQTDYDPETKRWEITFNVPLDTPDDIPESTRFLLYRAR